MSRIAALLIILGLAACGMRGQLERPSGPASEPLLGSDKAPAKDVSTTTHPKAQ